MEVLEVKSNAEIIKQKIKITGSEIVMRCLMEEGCSYYIWISGWSYYAYL
jgi:hypothetical protein